MSLAAVAFAAAPPVDSSLAARFKVLLTKMDDDDWRTREQATAEVAALPPQVLPLVETALRDTKLSPEVQQRLGGMIEDLRRNGAISAKTSQREAEFGRYRDFVLKQYLDHGKRDPSWDPAVRDAMVKHLAVAEYAGVGKASLERTIAAEKRALDLGCTDPLLRLCYVLDLARQKGAGFDQYDRANAMTEAMLASDYCASFKILALNARCHAHAARWHVTQDGVQKDKYLADLDQGVSMLPATRSDVFLNPDGVVVLAVDQFQMYVDTFQQKLHEQRRDAIAAKVAEASDQTWALVFTAKADLIARMNVGFAMPRGIAYAEHARHAASEALKLSPQSIRAANLKLAAISPQKDPDAFLAAYKEAIAIDPDDGSVRGLMMKYIVSQGDSAAVLKYGDECIATQAWLTETPVIAVDGISGIYNQLPLDAQDGFAQSPEVWQRIHAAYEGTLRVRPKDNALRSYYAYWSCEAGQWTVADEQFTILGDELDSTPFGSEAEAGYARRKAKRNAANTAERRD